MNGYPESPLRSNFFHSTPGPEALVSGIPPGLPRIRVGSQVKVRTDALLPPSPHNTFQAAMPSGHESTVQMNALCKDLPRFMVLKSNLAVI